MVNWNKLLLVTSLATLLMGCGKQEAASPSATAVKAENAYIRAMPPGQAVTAMFVTLTNTDSQQDRFLVSAKGELSKTIEIHEHKHIDGMMQMREISELAIEKGSQLTLKPGGYHLMLIDLQKPLTLGEKESITLIYKDGSEQTVEAEIKAINPHSH